MTEHQSGTGALQCAPPNGNIRRHGSYSYQRTKGGGFAIYKADTNWSANKIAELTLRGDEGRDMAANMVAALNAWEKYISTINFNLEKNVL